MTERTASIALLHQALGMDEATGSALPAAAAAQAPAPADMATPAATPASAGRACRTPRWPLDTTEPVGTEQLRLIVSAQAREHDHVATWPPGHLASGCEAWFRRFGAAALAPVPAGQAALARRARCGTAGCEACGAPRFAVEVLP